MKFYNILQKCINTPRSSSSKLCDILTDKFAQAGLDPLPENSNRKKRYNVIRVKGFFGCQNPKCASHRR